MAAGIQLFNADGSVLMDTTQWLLKTGAILNIGTVDTPGSVNVSALESSGLTAEVIVSSNEAQTAPVISKSNGVIYWNRTADNANFRNNIRVVLL